MSNKIAVLFFFAAKNKLKNIKMRDIKFRFWDTHRNQMISHEEINKEHAYYYLTEPEKYFIIPMQYIGLKDKNGIEIYEGDIIRILYTDWGSKLENDPRSLEEYLIDISSIGVVEFNNNGWEVKFWSKKYQEYSYSSINHGTHGRKEIVGNIYKNNELLTK